MVMPFEDGMAAYKRGDYARLRLACRAVGLARTSLAREY
jgi:hypothetical protein